MQSLTGLGEPLLCEDGHVAIAELVGEGLMVFATFGFEVEDADETELLLPNGAHADNSNIIARSGSKR